MSIPIEEETESPSARVAPLVKQVVGLTLCNVGFEKHDNCRTQSN